MECSTALQVEPELSAQAKAEPTILLSYASLIETMEE
jgi:hypothetical protein